MNTMNHKGYTARIEFDERDNIFVGRVLGLHTMISFHGATVAGLRSAFITAIEEFLRDCAEQGPSREACLRQTHVARASGSARRSIDRRAAAGKSLNQWATDVLEEATHG